MLLAKSERSRCHLLVGLLMLLVVTVSEMGALVAIQKTTTADLVGCISFGLIRDRCLRKYSLDMFDDSTIK